MPTSALGGGGKLRHLPWSPGKVHGPLIIRPYHYRLLSHNSFVKITFFPKHCRSTNVIINGIKYKVNAVLILNLDEELPEFGSISKIIVFANKYIYFQMTKYKTLEYNRHYHSYEVRRELMPEQVLLHQEMMATYMPIHTVTPYGVVQRNGALFVAPRFMVPDN